MSTRLVMYSLSKHIRSSHSGLGFSFDFILKELIGSNQGDAISQFLTCGREALSSVCFRKMEQTGSAPKVETIPNDHHSVLRPEREHAVLSSPGHRAPGSQQWPPRLV